jgi:hypothetical protein
MQANSCPLINGIHGTVYVCNFSNWTPSFLQIPFSNVLGPSVIPEPEHNAGRCVLTINLCLRGRLSGSDSVPS